MRTRVDGKAIYLHLSYATGDVRLHRASALSTINLVGEQLYRFISLSVNDGDTEAGSREQWMAGCLCGRYGALCRVCLCANSRQAHLHSSPLQSSVVTTRPCFSAAAPPLSLLCSHFALLSRYNGRTTRVLSSARRATLRLPVPASPTHSIVVSTDSSPRPCPTTSASCILALH